MSVTALSRYRSATQIKKTIPRKLKTLIVAEKQRVFEAVKNEKKKKDIAEEFGIPASTLFAIIKNSKPWIFGHKGMYD